MKQTLADAGNAIVPAYLALLQRGLSMTREPTTTTGSGPLWIAEDANRRFVAEDLVTLLGLVAIQEARGTDWQASDDEIDRFLAEYGVP